MKALILAAGRGTRLAPFDDHPKSLTHLENGETILDRLLHSLSAVVGKENVYLLVGYKKEMIATAAVGYPLIVNPHFTTQNTSKSLLLALEKLDDDLLWINGDVVCRATLPQELVAKKRTAMVVNQLPVGEEEVKYRTDGKGKILAVSKTVLPGEGEALGLNFFQKKDIPLLKKGLELCEAEDYFEKGIQYAIDQGVTVFTHVVDPDCIAEVDFIDDLPKANRVLKHS